MYKFIKTWSEFVLNETLKTNNIDFVIDHTETDLRLSKIDCDVVKKNNKIELTIYDFDKLDVVDYMFNYINSLFIDRNGWFPLYMKNLNDDIIKYDEEYLIKNQHTVKTIKIIFVGK